MAPNGREGGRLEVIATEPPALRGEAVPSVERFDPEPQRERLRGGIAVGLVVLFGFALGASFFLFWLLPDRSSDIKDFLPLVLTPLTSVVSAVVGFYYGAQTRREG